MACMRRLTCLKSQGICDKTLINCSSHINGLLFRRLGSNAIETSAAENDIPEYPPVKPRYPPGIWGNISELSAWNVHKWTHEQLAIPRVKERLEYIAGEKSRILWSASPIDYRPNNLEFKQHITKTHVINGLPADLYKGIDFENAYLKVKSVIPDLILQEHELLHKHKLEQDLNKSEDIDENQYIAHRLLGSITRTMLTTLLPFCGHLIRSQLDESVRVATFWHSGGFSGEERQARGKRKGFFAKDGTDLGVLLFQYDHVADWQVRSELPLPEFIPQDNVVCREGALPTVDYAPHAASFRHLYSRPINISGHWIGDPCEYGLLSFYTWSTKDYKFFEDIGEKYLRQAEISFGLSAACGSCMSQAYNQGFTYFLDLTYPLTTHCVLTNGKEIRFFAYQLNTMQLWNDGKPLRNILWVSEPMKMYDTVENGQVKGLNDEAFKTLLKLFMVKPTDRGIDMRPYLPDEEAPGKKSILFNFKGQDPFPVKKIGRWEYPKYPVYF